MRSGFCGIGWTIRHVRQVGGNGGKGSLHLRRRFRQPGQHLTYATYAIYDYETEVIGGLGYMLDGREPGQVEIGGQRRDIHKCRLEPRCVQKAVSVASR